MPEFQKSSEFVLPLSTLAGKGSTEFQRGAELIFVNRKYEKTRYKQYEFQSGALVHVPLPNPSVSITDQIEEATVPYFSGAAVIMLILFRNLYFASFQKYFASFVNNFEIDFNFQKIGLGPVFLGFLIVFLGLVGFFFQSGFIAESPLFQVFNLVRTPACIVFYPLLVSTVFIFFLSFSIRVFPLIFSDLKVLFLLSILAVIWKFVDFGTPVDQWISLGNTFLALSIGFFSFRSILFFQVFRKAYRFHIGLTLFYICALNLSTFLILFMVLQKETF